MADWVDLALQYIGYPSKRWTSPDTGNTPPSFDCSGFVQYILLESGISLPSLPGTDSVVRHTEEFFDFYGIPIHPQARKRGDLVFFSRNGTRPTHMGIYLEDNTFLHSQGITDGIIQSCYIDGRIAGPIAFTSTKYPQLYFYNPIGYKRPIDYTPGSRRQLPIQISIP